MNSIDLVIIALAALFAWRGFELGFVRQVTSIVGFLVGLLAGNWLADSLVSGLVASLLIITLSIVITTSAAELLGLKLRAWLHAGKLGMFDRAGGAVGGVLVTAVIVWIGSVVLPLAVPGGDRHLVRDSWIIGFFDRTLPPATDIMLALDDALTEHGLPSDFGQLVAPEQDRSLPSSESFAGTAASAQPSILRIEGRACNGIGTGSGYAVDQGRVVTNAHVVAGMRYPFVETSNGERMRAQVTYFDPSLDIAVLEISDAGLTPLSFAANEPATGVEAVALGYPGGGEYTASPSRILEHFTAISRDIYGERETRRSVYALQGNIQPGNSGGPVLDRSGQVIGTIFARSTTAQQVGYMLSSSDVADVVDASRAGQHNAAQQLRCIQ